MRAPYCPRRLTGEARSEWRRVAKRLQERGLLDHPFSNRMLEVYCVSVASYNEAKQVTENAEKVLKTDDGLHYPNPWFEILRTDLEQVHKTMAFFGFEPDERMRFEGDKSLAESLFNVGLAPG